MNDGDFSKKSVYPGSGYGATTTPRIKTSTPSTYANTKQNSEIGTGSFGGKEKKEKESQTENNSIEHPYELAKEEADYLRTEYEKLSERYEWLKSHRSKESSVAKEADQLKRSVVLLEEQKEQLEREKQELKEKLDRTQEENSYLFNSLEEIKSNQEEELRQYRSKPRNLSFVNKEVDFSIKGDGSSVRGNYNKEIYDSRKEIEEEREVTDYSRLHQQANGVDMRKPYTQYQLNELNGVNKFCENAKQAQDIVRELRKALPIEVEKDSPSERLQESYGSFNSPINTSRLHSNFLTNIPLVESHQKSIPESNLGSNRRVDPMIFRRIDDFDVSVSHYKSFVPPISISYGIPPMQPGQTQPSLVSPRNVSISYGLSNQTKPVIRLHTKQPQKQESILFNTESTVYNNKLPVGDFGRRVNTTSETEPNYQSNLMNRRVNTLNNEQPTPTNHGGRLGIKLTKRTKNEAQNQSRNDGSGRIILTLKSKANKDKLETCK